MATNATDRGLAENAKAAVDTSMRMTPTALEPYLRSAGPFLVAAAKALDQSWPYVEKAFKECCRLWAVVDPYKHDLLPILLGLLLIFFGGTLPLTIAAIEAFRLVGWEKTKGAVVVLWQQYQIAREASAKDDLLDENKDGIADVKQIDSQQLATRKARLFLRVADPVKLHDGLNGLVAGMTAVIAVLRLEFAQTIALGTSLGDLFTRTADRVLRPTLQRVLPQDLHKWIPLALSYSCRAMAISAAWWLQRVISALHSAMRGSDQLLTGLFALLIRYNIKVPLDLSPSHPAYPAGVTALTAFGFYYQLSRLFGLPFPFNILLLPLRILEAILAWVMTYGSR